MIHYTINSILINCVKLTCYFGNLVARAFSIITIIEMRMFFGKSFGGPLGPCETQIKYQGKKIGRKKNWKKIKNIFKLNN